MAETERQDRTEDATPKKLEDARRDGQIPRSRDLTAAAVMLIGGIALKIVGDSVARQLGDMMRGGLTITRERIFDESAMAARFRRLVLHGAAGGGAGAGADAGRRHRGAAGARWLVLQRQGR